MDYDLDAMDMNILEEARTILKKRWPEMVEAYLEDAQTYINTIRDGFADNDKQAVASHAHPLKSSSRGMGITGLGDIAETIEYGAKDAMEKDDDIAHLQTLVPLLEDALNRATPKLRATVE